MAYSTKLLLYLGNLLLEMILLNLIFEGVKLLSDRLREVSRLLRLKNGSLPSLFHIALYQMSFSLHVLHLFSNILNAFLDYQRIHYLLISKASKEWIRCLGRRCSSRVEVPLHSKNFLELIDFASDIS